MIKSVVVNLSRPVKRALLLGLDGAIVALAVWAAFVLRFEGYWPAWLEARLWLFPLAVAVSLPVFYGFGLYHSIIRYIDGRGYWDIAQAVSFSLLIIIAVWVFGQGPTMPRSVWVNLWILAFLMLCGSRVAARAMLRDRAGLHAKGERVAIYGAGDAGVQLAMALQSSAEFRPMLFVDDYEELRGGEILGLKVCGAERLAGSIAHYRITKVLLAVPSASQARRREILRKLEPLTVHVMAVPSLAELASGIRRVDDLREVEVEDILGRESVKLDERLLSSCIRNKSVMVTGGGGSIGAELCRQVVTQQPRRLVIYEISEYALYQIERELRGLLGSRGVSIELVPVLGSVCDRPRLESIMTTFRVNTVYHAAAYKHVPLVEQNPLEGVRNNIFGTHHAAKAAIAAGVETFMLISTDKAVRPTNVMGATKRFAELVLQGLGSKERKTRFCVVRFGNVLASSGSVVPLFREQIKRGGPVTVTHPEVMRYFMTISEAVQLVIQAGGEARGGDVFLLDMGEPVRIVDLAKRMIRLYGLELRDADHPNGDIEIELIGLRPGEKLFEELLTGERDEPTAHPMILRAREEALPWPRIERVLGLFNQAVERMDYVAVRSLLLESVQGYAPTNGIEDPVWVEQGKAQPTPASALSRSVH